MMPLSFHGLPSWALLPGLVAHLVAGIGIGWLYFALLRRNARQFVSGGDIGTIAASMGGRLTVLGGVLFLASREGALPLLVMALGIWIARALIMRQVQQASL